MRKTFFGYTLTLIHLLVLFTFMGCRDVTLVEHPYQRVIVHDFSVPLRALLPSYEGKPNSLTLRISGTITKPVLLTVNQLETNQGIYTIRRDTLLAGSYTNKLLWGDYYSNGEAIELMITGTNGTEGNLTIEWSRQ